MTSQTSFSSIQLRPEFQPMLQPVEMRMILLAGADVEAMEAASVRLFRAGHMPLIGAWFSDPLSSLAGLDRADEDTFHQIINPLGERLLARCDAVLRVGGPSVAGDAIVATARARGLRVFFTTSEAIDG